MERPNPDDGVFSTIWGLKLRDDLTAILARYASGEVRADVLASEVIRSATYFQSMLAGMITINPGTPGYDELVRGKPA